jgi:hypothetical protein
MGRLRLPIDAFMSETTFRVLIVDDAEDMRAIFCSHRSIIVRRYSVSRLSTN